MNIKLRNVVASILSTILLIGSALAANLTPRPWATGDITAIPTLRLMNITNSFGGNTTTTLGPNFGTMIFNSVAFYSDWMGMVVYVIFFAIPFLMMWIVQSDMTMPAIIGMMFSLYVFAKLPEQYILFAVGCFVICIAALLWSLYRRSF